MGRWILAVALLVSGCEPRSTKLKAPPNLPPVAFVASTEVRRLAVGWNDICLLMQDGVVRCKQDWRPTGVRVLGSFIPVRGADDVLDISAGHHHACARTKTGGVLCWGRNDVGEVGGAEPIVRAARRVDLPTAAVEVRVGDTLSCARLVSGAVVCWGNVAGNKKALPTPISWFSSAAGLGLSSDTLCAFSNNGLMRCSFGGGLPVEPAGDAKIVQVALGRWRGCALASDATVRCFPLSKPAESGGKVPAWAEKVQDLGDVQQLAAGTSHTCARRKDGSVWCFGGNDYGQLGNGSRNSSEAPVRVAHLTDADEIFAGGDRSCARRKTGQILCWGADLLADAMFRALTGLTADPGPPGPNDSLVPEELRVPANVESGAESKPKG